MQNIKNSVSGFLGTRFAGIKPELTIVKETPRSLQEVEEGETEHETESEGEETPAEGENSQVADGEEDMEGEECGKL
jgi:hypothetical protein